MFFVVRSDNPSPYFHPRSHHGRVKHRLRGGGCHRFHPYYQPGLLVDLDDDDGTSRWKLRPRHTVRSSQESDPSSDKGDKVDSPSASKVPLETTNSASTKASLQLSSERKEALMADHARKSAVERTEEPPSDRHGKVNGGNNIVVERTPVHRQETEDEATISMDVSGFTVDQLQVRLEEEQGGDLSRPILVVSGTRQNSLGDRFQIHRRFLLDRQNLGDNLHKIAISASFSKDGVLTIRVPKKKKKDEPEKVSRTIVVQQQTPEQGD